jgi:hypothetical protein
MSARVGSEPLVGNRDTAWEASSSSLSVEYRVRGLCWPLRQCAEVAVWGRGVVAVAAHCTPLPLFSPLLVGVGVIARGVGILRT